MTFRWLDDAALHEVWEAAVAIGLSSDMLRAGLPDALTVMMREERSRGEQLLRDLHHLNVIKALDDGSVPLRLWLETAVLMSRLQPKAAPFRRALACLERRAGGDPDGPAETGEAADSKPIWSVATVGELWQHPDATRLVTIMKAYPSPKELRAVAFTAGFDVTLVNFGQALDGAARDLVERSFSSSKLRSVIACMQADSSIKAWHAELRVVMDRGGGR
jgi:hypothetical protein